MPFERDENDLVEIYYEKGWTDGLPVVPPTREKIDALLKAGGLSGEDVLGDVAPNYGEATAEKVAINAVLAGCTPEHMPIVVAGVQAMVDKEFNLHAVGGMTDSATPLVIVNGPARELGGINCGNGVFGNGTRGNAVVGRALMLILSNIGGSKPGGISRTMFGSPARYSYCIGENEEESPWEPLYVDRRVGSDQGAVTLFTCEAPHEIRIEGVTRAEEMADILGRSMNCIWSADKHQIGVSGVILALGPMHAAVFGKAGWSKVAARNAIFQAAVMPGEGDERRRRKFQTPEALTLIVAGGVGGIYSMVMPGIADYMGTNMVTRPVNPMAG
ncbi:MAG: hypothetical protein HOC91_16240 [Nitrospinaceae bacterium]|jgi:hypothetical protein|nr:hypothetical protein [Nitrospinaceae bacterium]MBT4093068.1 hypothetical protein [Nitrospinaceae bacterium]MBT4432060.1 hypothetical protein [Nitrospinaceae bacterium]MBT6396042.1 hypothetical protein [Nitrospinaceae bacterium]MBT7855467.1 hypothetical protein [Nitrospinaceae bacterium]